MNNSPEMTVEKMATIQEEIDVSRIDVGASRFVLGAIMIMSSLVGVWGILCLIGGLANCTSFRETGRGLLTALTGL